MAYSIVFAEGEDADFPDVGNAIVLSAITLDEAKEMALVLPAPVGAAIIKVRFEGFVVKRLRIDGESRREFY